MTDPRLLAVVEDAIQAFDVWHTIHDRHLKSEDPADHDLVIEAQRHARRCGTVAITSLRLMRESGERVPDLESRLMALPTWMVDPTELTVDHATNEAFDAVVAEWEVDGDDVTDEPTDAGGWPIADSDAIRAVLEGKWEPPTPTLLVRTDGAALIYPGKVHSLSGEPGAAKTWIALAGAAEVLAAGGRAALIDHEDRLDTAVRRLVGMGVPADAILERFVYVTPTYAVRSKEGGVWVGGIPTNVIEAAALCDLVIIDSLGEALAHSQLSQNDDGEVANYLQRVARRLADGGAAVLLLDHVTKDKESQGRWAIGSQRKLAAIDGAAYTALAIKALTMEQAGRVKITCAKDRGGNYGQGSTVAMIDLVPDGDGVDVTISPPERDATTGEWLPTNLMERISRHLEAGEPLSGRTILAEVSGKDAHLKTALGKLIELGYVGTEKGNHGAVLHRTCGTYREILGAIPCAARPARPSAAPPRPAAVESSAAPAPYPYGAGPRSRAPETPGESSSAAPAIGADLSVADRDDEPPVDDYL